MPRKTRGSKSPPMATHPKLQQVTKRLPVPVNGSITNFPALDFAILAIIKDKAESIEVVPI